MSTRRRLSAVASFALTLAAVAGLVLVLLGPGSGAAAVDVTPAPSTATTAPVAPVAEVTASEQDAAFLADLVGPDADVDADTAFALTETARRVCALLTDPYGVPPGAEIPTREAMVETFTMPDPTGTTGWTVDEANRFIDTAAAAYCPELLKVAR